MASTTSSSRRTNQPSDVFVIGAGASVPYGFPTGANLIQSLRKEKLLYGQAETGEILASLGFSGATTLFMEDSVGTRDWSHSDHGKFCATWSRLVRGSVILTIDQFLKNLSDNKMRDLGKRLMARQILMSEREACKEPSNSKDGSPSRSMHSIDWIQELLTRVDLVSNWDAYLTSTTFLTFNYDRVLEFFVERYLVVDKNWTRADARQFIETKMSILHLNGHVGSLDQVPFGNLRGTSDDYDPLFDGTPNHMPTVDWAAVSSRMRTVWEDPEHHPDAASIQKRAKAATSQAKRIFVLGTSFIPENLQAIGLHPTEGLPEIAWQRGSFWATAKGLSEQQKNRAAEKLGIASKRLLDTDARDFVVDFVIL